MPFDGLKPRKRRRFTALWVVAALMPASVSAVDWSVLMKQGEIGVALPDARFGDWTVSGIRADVVNSVEADTRNVTVRFSPGSRLRVERIIQGTTGASVRLEDVRAYMDNVTVAVNLGGNGPLPGRSTVNGSFILEIGTLHHPFLAPQEWRFEGTVQGSLMDLQVAGQLHSESGLTADVTIRQVDGRGLVAELATTITGTEIDDILANTFPAWPNKLAVESGDVAASATLRYQPDDPVTAFGQVNFGSISGVFDRTAITDLDGRLVLNLESGRLSAGFRDVSILQINSGIGIGPVQVLADYTAPLADLSGGRLDVQQATAGFLGGRVRMAPDTIELGDPPWTLPVEVAGVSLSQLLQVYPTDGLEGTGELSGRVPVHIATDGIEVEQGKVSAVAPGGLLKLPAERLQGMLGNSQAMTMVVEALQNFHYSVLDSTIDYDKTGRLVLDLRLEGENPRVRGGQPVVLNINLEEDIPALLTSLQLSGRVNEAVTERVRERLQQSGQEAVP